MGSCNHIHNQAERPAVRRQSKGPGGWPGRGSAARELGSVPTPTPTPYQGERRKNRVHFATRYRLDAGDALEGVLRFTTSVLTAGRGNLHPS